MTAVDRRSIWVLPFKWIERTYGLLGLFMLVFAVALVAIHPPWGQIAGGFVPQVPHGLSTQGVLTFAYFAVAIISAVMFPYEAYFYSSGGIEEEWGPKDLPTNRLTAILGLGLGSLLAIAILASSAQLFGPINVDPQIPGTAALEAAIPFGSWGLILALLGMLFAIAGRGGRNLHGQRLFDRAIFRLGMGPPQEAVGSAALHHHLDRPLPARARHRADRRRRDDAGRLRDPVLDPGPPLTYLPLLLLAEDQSTWANMPTARSRSCSAGSISRSSRGGLRRASAIFLTSGGHG